MQFSEKVKEDIKALEKAMLANHITEIFAYYDGSEDSGSINDVNYSDCEYHFELDEIVLNICFEYLSLLHPSWKINSGGQGSFIFTIKNDCLRIKLEHYERVLHEHEFSAKEN